MSTAGGGRRAWCAGLVLAFTVLGGCRTDVDGLDTPGVTTPSASSPAAVPWQNAPTALDGGTTPGTSTMPGPATRADAGVAGADGGVALADASPPTVTGPPSMPPSATCSPGQVHCLGKVPQMCGADGRWVSGPACAYACQGGCVNRFAAVSSGRGSPTNDDGLVEFARNTDTLFSKGGGLLGARGFNVAVIDPRTGQEVEPVRNFDPWTTPLSGSALNDLAEYLEALEPGRLVMVATCDDAGITKVNSCDKHDTAPAKRVLAALTAMGSQQIGSYCYRGAWSFVAVTGQGRALAEKLSTGPKVTAEVMLPAMP